jgi:glutathione S-transferase
MKLLTYPGAPNPRRVHIFLAEKGIEIPFETVDMMKRENRTPEFIENVNLMGGLPVLELDDGSHIPESVSICRYLEALHPEPPLFGRDPREQARIDVWIRRMELRFMMSVGMVWVHGSPLTKAVVERQIEEVAEQNRKLVYHFFKLFDNELRKRPYVAGESFSMADIIAFTTLEFAERLNDLHPREDQKALLAWRDACQARPSAKA